MQVERLKDDYRTRTSEHYLNVDGAMFIPRTFVPDSASDPDRHQGLDITKLLEEGGKKMLIFAEAGGGKSWTCDQLAKTQGIDLTKHNLIIHLR